MASVRLEVSNYKIYSYAGPRGENQVAIIILDLPGKDAVWLNFYEEETTLPSNSKETTATGTAYYHANYHSGQFANILDLLRNEKPIWFEFNDSNLVGGLSTDREPVGEGLEP